MIKAIHKDNLSKAVYRIVSFIKIYKSSKSYEKREKWKKEEKNILEMNVQKQEIISIPIETTSIEVVLFLKDI